MYLYDVRESGIASYENSGTFGDMFSNVSAHEFGHVLGLFDAYGYGNRWKPLEVVLPTAQLSRASELSVMRSPWWKHFEYNDIEYEMLLYAWSTNSLQLYVDSVLGSLSQAFYH